MMIALSRNHLKIRLNQDKIKINQVWLIADQVRSVRVLQNLDNRPVDLQLAFQQTGKEHHRQRQPYRYTPTDTGYRLSPKMQYFVIGRSSVQI
jgi:hypothetical protein